jgi:hypothetical protein
MTRWLMVVALVACAKSDKPAKTEPAKVDPKPAADAAPAVDAAAAGAADCGARAKKLAERLNALEKAKPGMLPTVLPEGVALAASPLGKPVDAPGVVIVLTKDDKVWAAGNTEPLAKAGRLIEDVYWKRALEAAAMDQGPKKPWPIYVWADKGVKVASLAKLVSNEVFEDFKPRLLVEGETKSDDAAILDKPSVKKVHDALPKTDLEAMTARAQALRGRRPAATPCRWRSRSRRRRRGRSTSCP